MNTTSQLRISLQHLDLYVAVAEQEIASQGIESRRLRSGKKTFLKYSVRLRYSYNPVLCEAINLQVNVLWHNLLLSTHTHIFCIRYLVVKALLGKYYCPKK